MAIIDAQADILYSDLNFNLENVKYCDVLRNIIDKEFAMIESEQKFNETCAYVYEANRYLSEEEVFNDYADRFCKGAFAVDYNDDNLKISQELLNNIKNPDLADMLDSILANQDNYSNQLKDTIQHIDYPEFKDAIGHSTFEVIDEARNNIAVGVCHFEYVFPFNFKDYKVENEIKYMLKKFVQGCSNDDEELMNQSLTKAVMFANFCEKYSEKWINNNAERLLSDELTYNINNKLNNLDKDLLAELNHEIDKSNLSEDALKHLEDKRLALDMMQFDIASYQINFGSVDNQETNLKTKLDAFKDYCNGKNDNYIKYLKVEMPEQKKLVDKYNKLVSEMNTEYKQEKQNKMIEVEKTKEKRYSDIKKTYGIKKPDNQEQGINR